MARRPTGSVPSLQHHKPSNRARVTINGRDHWLGRWGSPEARLAYNRLIAEYIATGHVTTATPRPPAGETRHVESTARADAGDDNAVPAALTVAEVAALYLEHCATYYRSERGKRKSTYGNALQAVRAIRCFDDTDAADFGPKKLSVIRDNEARSGRPRVGCNAIVKAVRRLFKWAESQEYVPRGTHNSLMTVEPLRMGRTHAPELPPIEPVDDAVVEATLPYLPEVVADMVRVQRLTGARPGDVCNLRPMDIERSGEVWKWRPFTHKTKWRGKERVIMVGPRAQRVISRYLLRDQASFCFSPAESEKSRNEERRRERKSPMTPSQRARKSKARRGRPPRGGYDSASYRRAITRAVEKLNKATLAKDPSARPFENWAPNRIRHTTGTEVRRKYGLEAAQVVLGHASANITQIYAERDQALAAEVIKQIG
jgi:integrase